MVNKPAAVAIRAAVVDAMQVHAREQAPAECCGLLLGTRQLIERSYPARNARSDPSTYLIDPRDHFAAIAAARASGVEVIGYYHSHPRSPPEPSETDVAEIVPGDHFYLIVSGAASGSPDRIAAFWAINGNFRPVALVRVG
jgi:proteasome lid subunit RPN8/RPN11